MKKLITSILIALILSGVAQAAVTISPKYKPNNLSENTSFEGPNSDYDSNAVNAYLQIFAGKIIQLAGPMAVLMIVVAGLWLASSHGDSSGQAEEGKKKITYAIAGLLVILIAYVLVQTVITIIFEVDG